MPDPSRAHAIVTAELDRMGADPSAADVAWRIRTARLSPRERETLDHLAAGLTNAEIAHAMGLRVGTVKSRLVLIYAALGVSSRVQAALAWRAVVGTHHHPGDDDPH